MNAPRNNQISCLLWFVYGLTVHLLCHIWYINIWYWFYFCLFFFHLLISAIYINKSSLFHLDCMGSYLYSQKVVKYTFLWYFYFFKNMCISEVGCLSETMLCCIWSLQIISIIWPSLTKPRKKYRHDNPLSLNIL